MITITKTIDEVSPSIRSIIKSIDKQGRSQLLLIGGRELLRQTQANFGGAGQYAEKAWAALSKRYAKTVGRSNATLVKTGQLKNSIQLSRPRGNYIELFTRNKYAAAIAFGNKKNNLPPRNYWPLQNMGSPSYNRLTYNSERDLFRTMTTKLTILSNGSLPRQSTITQRMQPTYGSPFTGPQPSGD